MVWPLIMTLILFILGLVAGSFLTAYTYRLPRGKSVKKGRSICPQCKKQIAWYDNIPLLSFILLKVRCRNCKKKISFRYPAIELGSALGFVGIYHLLTSCQQTSLNSICHWQTSLGLFTLPFFLLIFLILLAIFILDIEGKIIPDELNFLGLIFVFLVLLFFNPSELYLYLLSGFGAALFLLLIHILTSGKGMGLGDVKLALFSGTLIGWPLVVVWLFTAFLTGAFVGIILLLVKKISFGRHIAFGPFLVLSLIIALVWGETLLNLFLIGF
jgi:prepilin signal peptidase PulO-like enzyme (type II secretory pathway)